MRSAMLIAFSSVVCVTTLAKALECGRSTRKVRSNLRTKRRDRGVQFLCHALHMSRRENYIKVVAPKLTERGIMTKHWPGNWEEEISFSDFALLRIIAALSVDSVFPPNAGEIHNTCGGTIAYVLDGCARLVAQGMLHPGSLERGCVLTPNGKRLVTDVTVYERYRPDAPRVPTS